tara:strand:+ start:100 stop:288 length:189 start_codon:yes stop_codon:yes gene_type:complete
MYGHNPEVGHNCPECGVNTYCAIEDGQCENMGKCSTCLTNYYHKQAMRQAYESNPYWDEEDD